MSSNDKNGSPLPKLGWRWAIAVAAIPKSGKDSGQNPRSTRIFMLAQPVNAAQWLGDTIGVEDIVT